MRNKLKIHKKRNRLLLLCVIIIIIGGIGIFLSKSGIIVKPFKNKISQELSKALQCNVNIGNIEGGIFGNIILKDIKLSRDGGAKEGFIVTIDKVIISYRVWDIIFKKSAITESIKAIKLIKPSVILKQFSADDSKKENNSNKDAAEAITSQNSQPALKFHQIKIIIENGDLKYKNYFIGNISCSGKLEDNNLILDRFSTNLNNIVFSGKGAISNINKPSLNLNIRSESVKLGSLYTFFPEVTRLGLRGEMSANFLLSGAVDNPVIVGAVFADRSFVKDVELLNFSTVFKYQANKLKLLKINSLAFNGKLTGSGSVDLENENLTITGEFDDINVKDVLRQFKMNQNIEGKAKLSFMVEKKNFFNVKGDLSFSEISFNKGKLPQFSAKLYYENDVLKIDTSADNKEYDKIQIHAVIPFKNGISAQVHAALERFSLKNLISLATTNSNIQNMQLDGLASAVIDGKGELKNIEWDGKILALNADLEGFKCKQLETLFTIDNKSFHFSSFKMIQNEGGFAEADVKIDLVTNQIYTQKLYGKKLNFSKLPFFQNIADLRGILDLNGIISGPVTKPLMVFELHSKELVINKSARSSFDANVSVQGNKIEIINAVLNNSYNLNGKVILMKDNPIFNIKVNINKGELYTIAALFKNNKFSKGIVDGKINISGNAKNINGDGYLSATNVLSDGLWIKDIRLGFVVRKNIINVTKFDITGNYGKLSSKALISFNDFLNADLKIEASISKKQDNFDIQSSFEIAGKVFHDGKKAVVIDGKFNTTELKINNTDLGILDFNFKFQNSGLSLNNLNLNNMCRGAVFINFSDKYYLDSSLKLSNVPLDRYLCRIFDADISGILNGNVRLKGKFPSPGIESDFHIKNCYFEKSKFGNVRGSVNIKDLNLIYLDYLELKEKDSMIFVKGVAKFAPFAKSNLNLSFKCANVSPEIIDNLLSLDLGKNVKGNISAECSIKGDIKSPYVKGKISVTNGSILNTKFDLLESYCVWQNNALRFSNAIFKSSQVKFSVPEEGFITFEKDGFKAIVNLLSIEELDLRGIKIKANLGLNVKMLANDEVLTGAVNVQNFYINNYALQNYKLQFNYSPKGLVAKDILSEKSNLDMDLELLYKNFLIFKKCEGSFRGDDYFSVKGILANKGEHSLKIEGKNADAAFLMSILRAGIKLSGPLSFLCSVKGTAEDPHITSKIKVEKGKIELWEFDTLEGGCDVYDNKLCFKDIYVIANKKYSANVFGEIPILLTNEYAIKNKEMLLNIKIKDGSLDLVMPFGWFNSVAGQVDADLKITGKPAFPVMNGDIVVREGAKLYPKALVRTIDNFSAKFKCVNNKADVVYMKGNAGEGSIDIRGGFTFKKLVPSHLDFYVTSIGEKPIDFNIQGLMTADVTGKMKIRGKENDYFSVEGPVAHPSFSGKLYLSNAPFTYPPVKTEPKGGEYTFLQSIFWNVEVIALDNMKYDNDYFHIYLKRDGNLNFTGPGKNIQVAGIVHASRGTFEYNQANFDVESGTMRFIESSKSTKVSIEAKGIAKISNVKIYADIRGDMGKLKVSLTSDPVLNQQQIASYLLLGEDTTKLTNDDINAKLQNDFTEMLLAQGVNMGLKPITKIIRNFTTLDDVSVKMFANHMFSDSANKTGNIDLFGRTEFIAGKYITERFYVAFSLLYSNNIISDTIGRWQGELKVEFLPGSGQERVQFKFKRENFSFGIESGFDF